MSFNNGFNKGFSLGFMGKVFNRGFSTKILSIQKIVDVIEETIDTSIITETNHRIDTIEHNTYTVDFSGISGNGYIIFEAPPAQFPNTLVTFNRIDTNTNAVAQVVNYTGGNTYYYINIGGQFTFKSDGTKWIQTTSDGLIKIISHTNYFVNMLESTADTYIIDYSNTYGPNYIIFSADPAIYTNAQIAFVRNDSNTSGFCNLFDQSSQKMYTIPTNTTKTFYSYNGLWNEVPQGLGGGGLIGGGGGTLVGGGGTDGGLDTGGIVGGGGPLVGP